MTAEIDTQIKSVKNWRSDNSSQGTVRLGFQAEAWSRSWPCSDAELRLKIEEFGVVGLVSFNVDVILEWGSEAWDIEGEHTGPLLANGASGKRAVSITSGAFEVLLVYLDTLEFAGELDFVEGGSIDVPDTWNVELLGVSGLDGIGISVGAGGHKDEVSLAANLGDSDAVAGDNISDLLEMFVVVQLTLERESCLGCFDEIGKHDFLFNIDSKEFIIK